MFQKPLYERFEDVPYLKHLANGNTLNGVGNAVRENHDKIHALFPRVQSLSVYTSQLNPQMGVYLLETPPYEDNLRALSMLPNLMDSLEIDLFLFEHHWLVNLREYGLNIGLPRLIEGMADAGLLKAEMHTHPGNDMLSLYPSFIGDLNFPISTPDGKHEIINHCGLFQYQEPTDAGSSRRYGSNRPHRLNQGLWRDYLRKENVTSTEQFNKKDADELYFHFLIEHFNANFFGWNMVMIQEVLKSKESL
ncbi:MAG: hypothetical protein NDI94_01675 [Candidatus Woesearchaeota archaeon]|nr:hypothetical protein [Candidatus Woesearchaeota archaeon]